MPISINGSGTISGISVGGLENGCVNEADLASAAVSNAKLAANAVTIDKLGTTEQSQLCKAWVNFNGTGTVAIRASYNVSSITDNGTGDYTVNFATALVDANYVPQVATNLEPGVNVVGSSGIFSNPSGISAPTAGSFRLINRYDQNGTSVDHTYFCVAIFR
jgi:hypothetical protein